MAPIPENEAARLSALRQLEILDTAPEAEFDDIAFLASALCGTPIALVSLIDERRQWFKSCLGLDVCETHRNLAFCAHAILRPDAVFVVEDALDDDRFRDNPLVTGPPGIRFYAGAQIREPSGNALGTLCVIDTVARRMTEPMERGLRILAEQIERLLEIRLVAREQNDLARELQKSESRFYAAIEAMHDGFVLQEKSGKIVASNSQASEILGLTHDQLMGRTSFDTAWSALRADGSPFEGADHPSMAALRQGVSQTGVVMGVRKPDGATTWISINAAPLFMPDEAEPHAAVATFADITLQRGIDEEVEKQVKQLTESKSQLEEANSVLERLATSDELTGLKNRRMFQRQLAKTVRRSQRLSQPISMLMIDVDRFKQYNDRFGHPAGDDVLRIVGATLQTTARSSDLVARYGGEEFVVLLPNTDGDRARIAAERFRTAIESVDWQLCGVTASIGVATQVGEWADAPGLIDEADQALYRSKQLGRNRVTHSGDEQVTKKPLHATVY